MSDDPVRALRELVERWKADAAKYSCTTHSGIDIHAGIDELEILLPAPEERERELRDALEWAYQHAQCDNEATTGEQEDFSDLQAAAWKVLEKTRAALNPKEKQP